MGEGLVGVDDVVDLERVCDQQRRVDQVEHIVLIGLGLLAVSTRRVAMVILQSHGRTKCIDLPAVHADVGDRAARRDELLAPRFSIDAIARADGAWRALCRGAVDRQLA